MVELFASDDIMTIGLLWKGQVWVNAEAFISSDPFLQLAGLR